MALQFNYQGKLALVTGSSRGIGEAIALYLGEQGCDILVHYRRQAEAAASVVERLRGLGVRAEAIQADLAIEADVLRMMDTIQADYGYLDFLVANAASTAFKTVEETKPHNIDLTFAIVIKSLTLMMQRAATLMAGRNGKVITISGMDAVRFVPRHSTLGAAKAGLEALTRYFACEYGPLGIGVNCVVPGPTWTNSLAVMSRQRGVEEYAGALQDRARRTPGGRLSRPEDVAPVVAFLCSDEARWIVGQTILVDGGFLLSVDPFSDREIEEVGAAQLGEQRLHA